MLKFQVEPHITEKGKGIPLSPSGCIHGLKGIGEKRKALLDKAFYGVRGIGGFTDFGVKKAWNIFFWHPPIIVHGVRGIGRFVSFLYCLLPQRFQRCLGDRLNHLLCLLCPFYQHEQGARHPAMPRIVLR